MNTPSVKIYEASSKTKEKDKMFKVLCILALVAVVSAGHGHSSVHISRHDGHVQEVTIKDKHGHHHVDYYAHPKYKFDWKVDDHHYHKEEHEHRDGHDNENKYHYKIEHIHDHHH